MSKRELRIEFVNRPSSERIFRAWAETECTKVGVRLTKIEVKQGEKDARIA